MEKKIKVALISSFTADLLPKLVSTRLTDSGIGVDWYVAPFNQVESEVRTIHSPSKNFRPSVVILLFSPEDYIEREKATLSLIRQYSRNFPNAEILVTNAYLLQPEQLGLYKSNNKGSVYYRIYETNAELIGFVEKLKNVHLLDFLQLISGSGRQSFFDARFHYLAKIPFSQLGLEEISKFLASTIETILGRRKKCLVLDLDNVLWGGVLTEDGAEHLKLDLDGEGKPFHDFQKLVLQLYNSGIILAICSKNDEKLALKAIRELPYMLLREDKFSAIRINWLDKAQNIQSIAKELNIGLNSIVFLDDTPFEQSLVRKLVPEVTVPKMPEDFSMYPSFLAGLPFFDTFSLTEEDTRRGELYTQERKRNELKSSAGSFNDFLRSLGIKVSVKKPDKWSFPRVAQLTQKTNQFNLSLNRYQETDIVRMAKDKNVSVLYVSAKDNLGDAGIVGVAILKSNGEEASLDTFLLSCRVMGRGIEDTMLHAVASHAKKEGAKILKARYNPTDKNSMVKEFLIKSNFREKEGFFRLGLKEIPKLPSWIKVENYE